MLFFSAPAVARLRHLQIRLFLFFFKMIFLKFLNLF